MNFLRSRVGSLSIVAFLAAVAVHPACHGEGAAKERAVPAFSGAPSSPAMMALPNTETLVMLTRTTLLTLNDAVRTGNFTVFRDRAAPRLREATTAATLAALFAHLSKGGTDLSFVATTPPQFTTLPSLDSKLSLLRVNGYFPLATTRLRFALTFESHRGNWLLLGITARPEPVGSAAASNPEPVPQKAATQSHSKAAPTANTAGGEKSN